MNNRNYMYIEDFVADVQKHTETGYFVWEIGNLLEYLADEFPTQLCRVQVGIVAQLYTKRPAHPATILDRMTWEQRRDLVNGIQFVDNGVLAIVI